MAAPTEPLIPLTAVERLAELVRAQRTEQGLNQRDLAALSGTGLRFIVDLEAAKPTVRLDKVLAVLETLGFTLHPVRPGTRSSTAQSKDPTP